MSEYTYTSQTSYTINPVTTTVDYGVSSTSPYTSNIGTAAADYGKTSATYDATTYGAAAGTTSGVYNPTASGTYGLSGLYGTASGTYGTATADIGRTSGTYGTTSYTPAGGYTAETVKQSGTYGGDYGVTTTTYATPGLSTSQVIGGTNYGQTTTTSYADYQPSASYTGTTSYQPATYTSTYGTSTNAPLNDYLSGLRQSVFIEVNKNIESKGPEFGRELRSHLESNVAARPEASRQSTVFNTLKEYNLIPADRLDDTKKLWQSINPNQNDQASNIPASYLPNASYTTTSYTVHEPVVYTSQYQTTTDYTVKDPVVYTSQYQATTDYTVKDPVVYTSQYQTTTDYKTSTTDYKPTTDYTYTAATYGTPSKSTYIETEKRATQSLPVTSSQIEQRASILSPYRNTMYPEFELVEDLPDRKHLIESINLFLKKSPQKESLLVSPSRVSIQRQSLLSPAKIEVSSNLAEKYEDGSVYEGEGRNGNRHGRGRLTFKDGKAFEGEFVNGRGEGTGVLYYKNGKVAYEGGFANTVFEGQGTQHAEAPVPIQGTFDHRNFGNLGNQWTKFQGEFRNGKRQGRGVLTLSNGETFEGEWRNDAVDGRGVYTSRDGRRVEGNWSNNVLQSAY